MNTCPSPEPLEARIAPAAMFTFTDVDGDQVTVSSSKGKPGDFHNAAKIVGSVLTLLDLSTMTFGAEFQGASITIAAKPGPTGGDGRVNVGYINAAGRDLLSVTVGGDLGAIDAGDSDTATAALGNLTVGSLGLYSVKRARLIWRAISRAGSGRSRSKPTSTAPTFPSQAASARSASAARSMAVFSRTLGASSPPETSAR